MRVFYRASNDAYVSVFHIDTNGFARLLHPGSPTDDHFVLGGREYRVLFPESRYWQVDEDEGKGYLFVVASPAPLDFSGFAYSRYEGGWDLGAVSQAGYRDPFLMMDDVIAALIPQWGVEEYALDFVAYDIDRPRDYPRFLCYGCHGFRPMYDWNPYERWCADFRVVIHDDPFYYPVYRYSGDRVVYTRPLAPARPMFAFKERAADEAATPLIRTRPGNETRAPARDPGRDASSEARRSPVARVPRLREPVRPVAPEGAGAVAPPPDASVPGAVVRDGGGRPATADPAASRDERPVLQRRGGSPPAGSARPPSSRSRTPPPARPPASIRRPPVPLR